MGCARRLEREYGVTIDSAMISDVPGYTWGLVPAMAQHGIKYFSIGTNHVHRIGHTLEAWADRPFYWVSPSGQEKVLCWVAGKGYSGFHPGLWDRIGKTKPEALLEYVEKLEASGFPYDIVQLRYSIDGDNGPPDPALPDFVKSWNERYVRPKLTIATTHELMQALAQRGAGRIPEVRGDFTPYWEDGAGSTARETALARGAAERLVQAETLFSLLRPEAWPVEDFYQAWRNVLLYNEHTWGVALQHFPARERFHQVAVEDQAGICGERGSAVARARAESTGRRRGRCGEIGGGGRLQHHILGADGPGRAAGRREAERKPGEGCRGARGAQPTFDQRCTGVPGAECRPWARSVFTSSRAMRRWPVKRAPRVRSWKMDGSAQRSTHGPGRLPDLPPPAWRGTWRSRAKASG